MESARCYFIFGHFINKHSTEPSGNDGEKRGKQDWAKSRAKLELILPSWAQQLNVACALMNIVQSDYSYTVAFTMARWANVKNLIVFIGITNVTFFAAYWNI